jgi:hypothetical protein
LGKGSDELRIDRVRENATQEDLITRYILGEVSEEERNLIEERFLRDDQYFEEMLSIEGALIDDYVQGKLPDDRRRRIEELLHSSRLQSAEADFVKNLVNDISKLRIEEPENPSPHPTKPASRWYSLLDWLRLRLTPRRFSAALSMILLAFIISTVFWILRLQANLTQITARQAALEKNNEELRQQVDLQASKSEELVQQLQSERNKHDQLRQEIATLQQTKSGTSVGDVVTLALSISSFTRSDGRLNNVHIPAGKSYLQVQIDTGTRSEYKSYSAVIKTFDGTTIWHRDDLQSRRAASGTIVLTLPGKLFKYDDYMIELKGKSEGGDMVGIGEYAFRVIR